MSEDTLNRLSLDTHRQKKKSGGWRLKGAVTAVVVLLASGVVLLLRGQTVTVEAVSVNRVFPTQGFTLLNASGYVVAQRKASVAAKTTGRLEWLGVEEGSVVTAGQVIARLENKDLQAARSQSEAGVQSAQAQLEQARAEQADADQSFARTMSLLKQGIVAQAEYDSADARLKRAVAAVNAAEAGVRSAKAALQGAAVNLDYSLIRAPFDAVVLTKNADVGDIITPLGAAANAKAAVVTIADLGSLQVEADVSETNLAQVRKGQPCEITLDGLPDRRFRGYVHTVVPTADRAKASVMVKVGFSDKDRRIMPEMSAKVAFLEHPAGADDLKPRLVLNPAAFVTVDGREGVYLVSGERVKFTPLRRGGKLGDAVEIDGLKSGDKVALKPLAKLKDGTRITLPEK